MISEKLQLARKYEEDHMNKIPETDRPMFHVTGGVGWINDPNGFAAYNGEYHLFFQYHPYSTHWGPMHWGHVKTRDFIVWERLPVSLAPDCVYDEKGCFSGGSVELPDGKQLLIYTGVSQEKNEEGVECEYQQQCIAVGDGLNYTKSDRNPVIDSGMIPDGSSKTDFRDPKIWKDYGKYYVVTGNRASDGSGQILLYESANGIDWNYLEIVDKSDNKFGKMWECPDYYKLGDKYILAISPQEMQANGMEFHPGNCTAFLIGTADNWLHFKREKMQAIDYGLDFYAPQSLLTKDGRRVMIGWMQNWDTSNYGNDDRMIYGQMSIPRVLEWKGDRVIQNPVEEIKNYYGKRVAFENVVVEKKISFPEISGRVLDMTVEIQPTNEQEFEWFQINVAQDDEKMTIVYYNPKTQTVKIDRTRSGDRYDVVNTREFMVKPREGKMKFRLLLDRYSVELFVNDGEQAASMVIHTPLSADQITFDVSGCVTMNVEKIDLEEKLCEQKNMM